MTLETANRLYELRKKHDLSQEELAEKLGVSRQAVSKWERSEASPDTDNLIALAKIYGLSLDELIFGEKSTYSTQNEKTTVQNDEASAQNENASEHTDETSEQADDASEQNDEEASYIVDDGNSKVTINPSSIVIEDEGGEIIKIGLNGIRIESSKADEEDGDPFDISLDPTVIISDDGHVSINVKKRKDFRLWLERPYPIICVIAYLIFGFYGICGGWAHAWIVFITIPIYYTLVEAIYNRKLSDFAFPVLTAFVYLYLGLYHGNWHPSWIVFLTIPVYYPIAMAIDKKISRTKGRKEK